MVSGGAGGRESGCGGSMSKMVTDWVVRRRVLLSSGCAANRRICGSGGMASGVATWRF